MKTKYYQGKKDIKTKMVKVLFGAAFFTLHSSLFTSCTDWDDHYDANTALTGSQQGSLWSNIEQNAELSQFASLLKKTGYNELLNQAQSYTVWAPKDGTFDFDALQNESNDRLQRQFVENHIARNNYPASGQIDERIYMLNKKVMNFVSTTDGYSMQDIALQLPSIGGNNGIIHTISSKIPFLPNIYESLNNEQFNIDSIADYYHSYDTLMLDENRSVQGPAVNGEITYLDTIYTEHNALYSRYRAYINREDSSYSMLVPTNTAWEKAKAKISQYYQYPEELRVRKFIDITTKKDTTIKVNNPAYLQDSIANKWLLANLFFNNRLYDNKKLATLQDGQALVCDSLVNTLGWVFYADDAAKMLAGSQRVDKSNGTIFVTDELSQPSWIGWCPPIKLEAEYTTYLASYENTDGTPSHKRVTIATQNPNVPGTVSNGYYLEVPPYSSTADEKITFFIPAVRSATYHIYAVMVPSNIKNVYQTEVKPNRFKGIMGYSNINATSKRLELKEETLKNSDGKSNFETNATKVDTLDLGEVTFPHCYTGLDEYYPFIRFESNPRDEHDRTLRIDCIMLIPKELDDELRANPNYKFYW